MLCFTLERAIVGRLRGQISEQCSRSASDQEYDQTHRERGNASQSETQWVERMLYEHFFPQSAKINVKANLWYRADEGRRGERPK
jgi:hypothetical protein